MEIRLGPAGLPIGLKESRNTVEGIKFVHEIGLNAMEIEFVRNIYLDEKSSKIVGKIARDLDVKLSIHAPYFINLLSEKSLTVLRSKKLIIKCMELASLMGASPVVVHSAYYGKLKPNEAFKKMVKITKEILLQAKKMKLNTQLSYETMAKTSQFGSLEELLKLKEEVNDESFSVTVDFAHIFVRNNGKIDYKEIFDKIEESGIKTLHSHFSNVKYSLNKKRFVDIHIPINSHPPFKPLAEEILRRKKDITIISESPLLEKDSLKMKKIFEFLGYNFKL